MKYEYLTLQNPSDDELNHYAWQRWRVHTYLQVYSAMHHTHRLVALLERERDDSTKVKP